MIANAMGLEQDAAGAEGFSDEIPVWAVGSVGAVVKAVTLMVLLVQPNPLQEQKLCHL